MHPIYPILLSGKQGSGKSTTTATVRSLLEARGYEVSIRKFADTIYLMQDAILAILAAKGIQVPKKDGKLLQLLGTEWGRQTYGQDIWVNCTLSDYHSMKNVGEKPGVLIIDDCRFKNELAAFRNIGFTVRLEADRDIRKARADAWRDTENHISETDLDDSLGEFDHVHRTDVQGIGLDHVSQRIADYFDIWVARRREAV